MAAEADSEQTSVVTYVPEQQKTEWKQHAEELGMSQAEFVRTMVQAGRKEFTITEPDREEPVSPDTDPRGSDLETRVLDALESGEALSWDQLVERLSTDFEDRLADCLESLQAQNRVQHSGRDGGYTTIDQ
ncbi:MAG: hypothetical protein A07HN63_01156 [uncultured archaeon A07HN63]|nr:MAG: hypothetical protein A07HN63_01156 [uncultured archaeon A07HN63]